ncbi:MAG: hypothetical protein ACK53L_34555, partial [Pirellulaceae bacterium]
GPHARVRALVSDAVAASAPKNQGAGGSALRATGKARLQKSQLGFRSAGRGLCQASEAVCASRALARSKRSATPSTLCLAKAAIV